MNGKGRSLYNGTILSDDLREGITAAKAATTTTKVDVLKKRNAELRMANDTLAIVRSGRHRTGQDRMPYKGHAGMAKTAAVIA